MVNMQMAGGTTSSVSPYSRGAYSSSEKAAPAPQNQAAATTGANVSNLARMVKQGYNLSIAEEQIVKAIERAVKALEGPSTMFEMKVHEATNAIVVKVLNKETGEIIREIPPEKTLDLVAKMMEFAGILIDERV